MIVTMPQRPGAWTLVVVPTRLIEQLARVSKVNLSYQHYVTTGDRTFRWCATRPLTERDTPASAFRTHTLMCLVFF